MNILTEIEQETGEEFLERVLRRPGLCGLLRPRPLPRDLTGSDVVEIRGDSGAGKTLLLEHLICEAILPKATGGCEAGVLLVDVDHKIKSADLQALLEAKLGGAYNDEVVEACLERLLILSAFDAESFALGVLQIPAVLKANKNISLVAVDSIGGHFHASRLDAKGAFLSFERFTRRRVKLMKSQMAKFPACVLIYTLQPFGKDKTVEESNAADTDGEWRSSGITFRVQLDLPKANTTNLRLLSAETRTHVFRYESTLSDFTKLSITPAKHSN